MIVMAMKSHLQIVKTGFLVVFFVVGLGFASERAIQ
jgi:hypothetical protein